MNDIIVLALDDGAELLDAAQTATAVTLSPGHLANSRANPAFGLPHVKIGKRIYYRRADVDAFIASRGCADVSMLVIVAVTQAAMIMGCYL